ncbi:DUF58 domain-containing protein [Natronolimnobius sp. AArcel1]|uniref:DUF58 domain-containing protein n=1 Tax=Natronolimnobius sp. AArcel1 TaxID=1679093 RepID=UPI0013ED90CA|nr:DUF58 domain-containing protein [Natronolimnobius sp. AArcel1]NGM69323.1 DUF58 domain-containing protein [Natronolimnobius sp. AArcel1]
MNYRQLALLGGLLLLAGAIGVAVGAITLSLHDGLIILVGLVALAVGLKSLLGRRGARVSTTPPEPERRAGVPAPGETISDAIGEFRSMTSEYSVGSRRIASGLRIAATGVLTRFEGHSREAAEAKLDDGTWTDDAAAGQFLAPERHHDRSLRDWLPKRLRRQESSFQSAVRHTSAAIANVGYNSEPLEGDGDGSNDDASPDSLPIYRGRRIDTQTASRTSTATIDGVELREQRSTEYWTGIGVVALFAVGIGAVAEAPAVALAGVIGVGYAGFAHAFEPPELEIDIERALSVTDPEPGEEVDITVTLTNESGRFIPDLRFIDGVPPGLAVTQGSSRLGTALRPQESVTLEYTVLVQRGTHTFDPALAIVRDLSRSREREYLVESETAIVCEPVLRPVGTSVPLRSTAASFSGRLMTSDGGSGTTFHSVREYRPNDPLSRIDWNRHAKTGELATLEFHEERAARVVVLVDARKTSFLAPDPDATHAVDRSVGAASRIAASLLAEGDTVGLAALGPVSRTGDRDADADPCWLAPASGRDHEVRLQDLLATHPQFDATRPESESRWLPQLRTLRRRLSAETQIIFLSPLCDTGSVTIARQLESRGHPVTVVSPDPTTEETASQQLAAVARRVRRFDLQRIGIPVIDWPDDESIDEVFARHAGGRR